MAVNWADRITSFSLSPSRFLFGTTAESFLAELLYELRDDRASYSVKVKINKQKWCENVREIFVSTNQGIAIG